MICYVVRRVVAVYAKQLLDMAWERVSSCNGLCNIWRRANGYCAAYHLQENRNACPKERKLTRAA
jgi:hypothetical protein